MKSEMKPFIEDTRGVSGLVYLFILVLLSALITVGVVFLIIYQMYGTVTAITTAGLISSAVLTTAYILYIKLKE